jgi:hypothetical protein
MLVCLITYALHCPHLLLAYSRTSYIHPPAAAADHHHHHQHHLVPSVVRDTRLAFRCLLFTHAARPTARLTTATAYPPAPSAYQKPCLDSPGTTL